MVHQVLSAEMDNDSSNYSALDLVVKEQSTKLVCTSEEKTKVTKLGLDHSFIFLPR